MREDQDLAAAQREIILDPCDPQVLAEARKSGIPDQVIQAVLGFSSAFAAYGAFFIPKSFGTSITLTGGQEAALYGLVVFYLSCILMTWWLLFTPNAEMPC